MNLLSKNNRNILFSNTPNASDKIIKPSVSINPKSFIFCCGYNGKAGCIKIQCNAKIGNEFLPIVFIYWINQESISDITWLN